MDCTKQKPLESQKDLYCAIKNLDPKLVEITYPDHTTWGRPQHSSQSANNRPFHGRPEDKNLQDKNLQRVSNVEILGEIKKFKESILEMSDDNIKQKLDNPDRTFRKQLACLIRDTVISHDPVNGFRYDQGTITDKGKTIKLGRF